MFRVSTKKYIEDSKYLNELTSFFIHKTNDVDIEFLRGYMFSLFNFKSKHEIRAKDCVKVFLESLEDVYFTNLPLNIPQILERSIKNALFKLNDYLEKNDAVDNVEFDFSCVVIKDDILYLAKVGEANIYLIRNNKRLDIGRGMYDVSNPKLIETGSGILKEGDKIIIANNVADKLISDWPMFSRYSESEIDQLMKGGMEEDKVAIVILTVEKEEIPKEIIKETIEVKEKKSIPLKALINKGFLFGLKDKIPQLKQIIKNYWGKMTLSLKERKLPDQVRNFDLKSTITNFKPNFKNIIDKIKKFKNFRTGSKKFIFIGIFVLFIIVIILVKNVIDYNSKVNAYNSILSKLSSDKSKMESSQSMSQIDELYSNDTKLIDEAKKLKVDDKKIESLAQELESFFDNFHQIINIKNASVITDFSKLSASSSPVSIDTYLDNELLISDSGTNNIYELNVSGINKPHEIDSNLIISPSSLALADNGDEIILDKSNGVLLLDSQHKVSSIAGLSNIKNIVSLTTYQNNIYLLDVIDNTIYKSAYDSGGYSLASKYLINSSISSATSLAVDYGIFLTSPGEGVLRFLSKQSVPFNITDIDKIGKPLGPLTYIYNRGDKSNIYLIDPQNKRVIKILKIHDSNDNETYRYNGQYVYTGDGDLFNNLISLTIDKKEQNMYLLNGTKVIKISL